MPEWLTLLVSGVLGGGVIAGAASLITARSVASKNRVETKVLQDKAPAEVDSITVQGAEQAVLSMERSMKAAEVRAEKAEGRILRLEEEREEDRKTIEKLQKELREVSTKAEHAEAAAGQAREAAAHLQEQLDAMVRTRNGRNS